MNMKTPRLAILLVVISIRGDDSNSTRYKRFFQNLNSYFTKSTESPIDPSKINVSRNLKPVYVFDNDYLCNIGSNECKNSNTKQIDTSTPVTYLTPPSRSSEQFGKFGESSGIDYTQNGYVYPNQDFDWKNPTQNGAQSYSDHFKVSVFDVLCIKSSRNGKFTVGMVTSRSTFASPIIENSFGAENPPQCSVATINSTAFRVNIREPDLINCGVYYCSSDTENNLMCMNLRFPLIPGLKTSDDISVRIQCHPRQQLLSHVKQLQLKPSHLNSNIGRSLPVIATVSNTNANQELHTDVSLYALTTSGYTHLIRTNDAVTLGDELQLRGVVRSGDGWQYSRFGRIIVQRVLAHSSGYNYGENNDAVVIIADDGCVNNAMKVICPNAPFNDPSNPLVSMLNMKMFIFNNMKDGDELAMSITMFGCVHHEDCFTDITCHSRYKDTRVKRSNPRNETNAFDSTSEIRIKIKTTPNMKRMMKCDENECEETSSCVEQSQSSKFYIILICCVIGAIISLFYHYFFLKSMIN